MNYTVVDPYWLYKYDEDVGVMKYPVADWGDGLLTRGSVIDLSGPYIVAVGAAQTFGRFVEKPYIEQLAASLGVQSVNFGYAGAGPGQLFRNTPDPARVMQMLNGARLVVIQVMSARSCSNSRFTVEAGQYGRCTDDGHSCYHWDYMKRLWLKGNRVSVRQMVEESCTQMTRETAELIRRIRVPKILLWMSNWRRPGTPINFSKFLREGHRFPQFVTAEHLRPFSFNVNSYVEHVSDEGLPRSIRNDDGKQVVEDRYYPPPAAHREVCRKLRDAIRFSPSLKPLFSQVTNAAS